MDDRLYKMYDKIEDAESLLIAARARKQAIEAEKLSGTFKTPEKVNIEDQKANIENSFTSKTASHVCKLLEKFDLIYSREQAVGSDYSLQLVKMYQEFVDTEL